MSDRACIRGCTERGVHYAECAWYGVDEALIPAIAELPNVVPVCKGCAPVEAREGSMICGRCFGRMRRFITDAPDLLGRLRSLADPSKAMTIERRSGGRSVEAPAPVPADLIDAAECVMRSLRSWAVYVDRGTLMRGGMPAGAGAVAAYEYAHECSTVILEALPRISNNRDDVLQLATAVLDVHPADEHGERPFWSIVDAVSRYRLERPDETQWMPSADDEELHVSGVSEWGDKLISRAEAEKIAGHASTLRRWVAKDLLTHAAVTWSPSRVTWFRESDVRAVLEQMGGQGRVKTPNLENRSQ